MNFFPHHRKAWLVFATVVLAILMAIPAFHHDHENPVATAAVPANRPVPHRPVYPFSVVPGGVENAAELREAVKRDPVVAAHYADFDLKKVRVERVSKTQAVFVSYRVKDRISWTRKRMQLREGETILTDGVHRARARCGNRIADSYEAGASAAEPEEDTLDVPLMESRMAPLPLQEIADDQEIIPAEAATEPAGSAPVTSIFALPQGHRFPIGLLGLLAVIPPAAIAWLDSGTSRKPAAPSLPRLAAVPVASPILPGTFPVPVQPSLPVGSVPRGLPIWAPQLSAGSLLPQLDVP